MNKNNFLQIIPFLFLAAYVIYDSYNFFNLDDRIQFMLEKPVQVLQYSREIRTRLKEMQNTMPGLLSQSDLTYSQIVAILKRQEDEQDKAIAKVGALSSVNPEILQKMRVEFRDIRILRRQVSHMLVGNDSYMRSLNLFNELLEPRVKVLIGIIDEIINTATQRLENVRVQSSRIARTSSLITFCTGCAVALLFYVVIVRDRKITARLADSDHIFGQISRNVDEIFIVAADVNKFNYGTPNSKRIIGLEAADILANPAMLYEFLPAETSEWLKENLQNSLQNMETAEKTLVADMGTQVLRLGIHPFRDGAECRAIIAIQDNTESFRRQQALETALETAHSASAAKSTFLSHMSHEIRTPMNAIIGMTTIALSKIGNRERVEDCLLKISESSGHLLRLINDVLDMSKIENGKLAINNEPFSLADSIRNINDLIRPQATARQLDFEILQEGVETEDLIGDSLRLNQILLNILSNSLKFTPAGGSISLKIRQISRSPSHVRLAFLLSDTGIGMNEQTLKKIYMPFEQANASTAMRYGGTGLGMSITFNLVNLMGGAIQAESEEGKGTRFTIELPFGYHEQDLKKPWELPPLKILVVDDDPGTCEHAALLLEKMGMQVQVCYSGMEAVRLVKEAKANLAPYNVCFIDWKMPDMDGAETASKIRELVGHDVLIIIITAYDWSPIEEKAKASGVDGFLGKPFFTSSLYNSLKSSSQKLERQTEGANACALHDFSGKRILLAEDNDFNREIANEFLEMANATVENAENGQEAVNMFIENGAGYYDLILMDIQMPIMNGYEAAEKIRASKRKDAASIPILAMTANAFSEDVAHAKNSGMNDHIAKPIDIDLLYEKLEKYLSGKA